MDPDSINDRRQKWEMNLKKKKKKYINYKIINK